MTSDKACGWQFSSSAQLGRPQVHREGSEERLCSPVFQDHLLQDACPGAAGRINEHPGDLTAPSTSRPIAPCCVCFPCLTWQGRRTDWLVCSPAMGTGQQSGKHLLKKCGVSSSSWEGVKVDRCTSFENSLRKPCFSTSCEPSSDQESEGQVQCLEAVAPGREGQQTRC